MPQKKGERRKACPTTRVKPSAKAFLRGQEKGWPRVEHAMWSEGFTDEKEKKRGKRAAHGCLPVSLVLSVIRCKKKDIQLIREHLSRPRKKSPGKRKGKGRSLYVV